MITQTDNTAQAEVGSDERLKREEVIVNDFESGNLTYDEDAYGTWNVTTDVPETETTSMDGGGTRKNITTETVGHTGDYRVGVDNDDVELYHHYPLESNGNDNRGNKDLTEYVEYNYANKYGVYDTTGVDFTNRSTLVDVLDLRGNNDLVNLADWGQDPTLYNDNRVLGFSGTGDQAHTENNIDMDDDFTIMLRVSFGLAWDNSTNQTIFEWNPSDGNSVYFGHNQDGTLEVGRDATDGGGEWLWARSEIHYSQNTWYDVAVTYDDSEGNLSFYWDGSLEGYDNRTGGNFLGTSNLYFGQGDEINKERDYAIHFDGDGNIDYAKADSDDSLNISNNLTVSSWIKPSSSCIETIDDVDKGLSIINKWNELDDKRSWRLFFGDHNVLYGAVSENGSDHNSAVSLSNGTSELTHTTWYHVVMKYSDVDGKIDLYVNGTSDTDSYIHTNASSISVNDTELVMGEHYPDGDDFVGSVSSSRLYDSELSDSSIQNIYDGDDVTSDLVSHWPIDEGHGTITNDSVDSNDFHLIGDTTWEERTRTTGDTCNFYGYMDDLFRYETPLKKSTIYNLTYTSTSDLHNNYRNIEIGNYVNFWPCQQQTGYLTGSDGWWIDTGEGLTVESFVNTSWTDNYISIARKDGAFDLGILPFYSTNEYVFMWSIKTSTGWWNTSSAAHDLSDDLIPDHFKYRLVPSNNTLLLFHNGNYTDAKTWTGTFNCMFSSRIYINYHLSPAEFDDIRIGTANLSTTNYHTFGQYVEVENFADPVDPCVLRFDCVEGLLNDFSIGIEAYKGGVYQDNYIIYPDSGNNTYTIDISEGDEFRIYINIQTYGNIDELYNAEFYYYSLIEYMASTITRSSHRFHEDYSFKQEIVDRSNAKSITADWNYTTNRTYLPRSIYKMTFMSKMVFATYSDNESDLGRMDMQEVYVNRYASGNEIRFAYDLWEYEDPDTWDQNFVDGSWHMGELFSSSHKYDRAGWSWQLETGEGWTGEATIYFDLVVTEFRTADITTYLYNYYTGVGLTRETLILEYNLYDGDGWVDMGYDAEFKVVQGRVFSIRALDYWDRVIYVNSFAVYDDQTVKIPVRMVTVHIEHPGEAEDYPPEWEVTSLRSGKSRNFTSWSFDVIAGEYKFKWEVFGPYLDGEEETNITGGRKGNSFQDFSFYLNSSEKWKREKPLTGWDAFAYHFLKWMGANDDEWYPGDGTTEWWITFFRTPGFILITGFSTIFFITWRAWKAKKDVEEMKQEYEREKRSDAG